MNERHTKLYILPTHLFYTTQLYCIDALHWLQKKKFAPNVSACPFIMNNLAFTFCFIQPVFIASMVYKKRNLFLQSLCLVIFRPVLNLGLSMWPVAWFFSPCVDRPQKPHTIATLNIGDHQSWALSVF